jgi:serine protease Do
MKPWKQTLRAAALCAAAVLMPAPALAQRGGEYRDVSPPRADPQFLAAFRGATAASKCTVRVLCDGKEAALGTVVGPDGWALTKYSLLSEPVACKLKDGRVLEARVVGAHERFDLAMLKVEAAGLPAVTFTESKAAPVGSWLVSVGADEAPVAVGVLSVASRSPAAQPRRGGGRPNPAATGTDYLGVRVAPEGPGAKVDWVFSQSAAAKAGVKMDDTLLSVQGNAVSDQRSLLALLGKMKPGDVVTLKLLRDGKELELKATLAPRRARGGRPDQNLMGSELSERRTGFPTYFQSDAVLKPKDCGGPVCDLEGRVLGVNIARAGRVESYAVPSEAITPLLADLMSGELPPKTAALERQVRELKTALKKAEEDRAAAEARLRQAREALQKQEADRAEAEKRAKEAREALDKAQKELKDKKSEAGPER